MPRHPTIATLMFSIAALVTSCSQGSTRASPSSLSSTTTTTSATSTPATKGYALLGDPAWTLTEAVDPPAGDPLTSIEQPPLDWYAEYSSLDQSVRLSGHATTLARAEALLTGKGFKSRDIDVKGRRAVQLWIPGDTPQSIIALDRGPSVLMVLSYELTIDELAQLASTIRPMDRAQWVSAGGVVR